MYPFVGYMLLQYCTDTAHKDRRPVHENLVLTIIFIFYRKFFTGVSPFYRKTGRTFDLTGPFHTFTQWTPLTSHKAGLLEQQHLQH